MNTVPGKSLLVFQSMWAMERRGPGEDERSLEENVAMIAKAGFDGISADWTSREQTRRLVALLGPANLAAEAMGYPKSVGDLRPVVENAVEFGAKHICIQADTRPRRLEECLPLLEGWQRLADDAGVPLYIETHRARMTNDLHFTLDLLDRMPDLQFVADLSHYVVGREILLPVSDENEGYIRRILNSAGAFHGRIASSEQIQLELEFSHNKAWVDQFFGWWEYGFRRWRERADENDVLAFTCELGPRPYAISDGGGFDSTDRWREALVMMGLVRQLWSRLDDETNAPRLS